MVSYPSINLIDLIIDEVALEGLDGIAIEALWLRLAHRLHIPLPFTKSFMVQIWSMCVQIREFAFYELETAREPLEIFDRYQFVDPDLGTILEPEHVPPDIYPHCPINDVENDIKGSCSTYYTRKDITQLVRSLSLNEATEKYGQKLIIVASQSSRNQALMGDEVSPILEINVIRYCFLERVGRSRYHGEVTQGKHSLSALKEDPKSLFYHRKFLLRHKLITKQMHHQKSGILSTNGSLLHLPRFFVERKPKVMFLAEEVIKILKSKPNCIAEYDEIKRKLQIENSIKKLFKTSFFQKAVKTDIRVPYRTMYPNATPEEWQTKSDPKKEKNIKVVQLLSPDIDLFDAWNKDEIQEAHRPNEINVTNHVYNVPYLKQANRIIEATKSDGICQGELCKAMGLTKLQSRALLRNVVRTNIAAFYMSDNGRQRLARYVSKKYEKNSKLSKQFTKEIHKIQELTKQTKSNDLNKNKIITKEEESNIINDEKENAGKSDIVKKDSEIETRIKEIEEPNIATAELQTKFYIVNLILHKYGIIKRPNRYKFTFSNYRSGKINRIQMKKENSHCGNISLQLSKISDNKQTTAMYKNIKIDITIFKPTGDVKPDGETLILNEALGNSEKKIETNVTYRLLRRMYMIMKSVKDHQVIDDVTKLMKMIHEEEDKEGYDVKIDKKSLLRLLQKLARVNLVKLIEIKLSAEGKEKILKFVCDSNIDVDNSVIQSAIEQAKLKFYLVISHKPKLVKQRSLENFESNENITNKSKNQSSLRIELLNRSKVGPRVSRKYGYSPKFVRMQTLHIFLYYLVYEHPGEQTLSRAEQLNAMRSEYNITDELSEEFSTIYTTSVSWRMFVPPLPKYNGWPKGWALMCDVLLRLPLSIFLKIHYILFTIPEIENYVNHPIRKHYLVKDLPVDIRNLLLYSRKYIFHIHETVTRLCYLGLVQFGPQKLKEKDQVFIYMNRRTELMDTTSSEPSYHQIEEKPYPVTKYTFDEMQVVEKYWYDMWNTCMNTPLGGRLVVQGKDIVLEDLVKKNEMIQATIARSPEEAAKLDTGKVPGDRKGAAGIDSACFAHLKRNWNWGFGNPTNTRTKTQQKNIVYEREAYLAKIKAKPIRFTEFPGFKTVSGPPSLNATELRKKIKNKDEDSSQYKYEALTCQRSSKQKSYVRRVLPRKCVAGKRGVKYDEVDYRALQRMHKLRVDWDPREDKILIACKVAMVYLCPNHRKQMITFTAVRDMLLKYSHCSHNKTSRACQRRLLYMMKQQRNVQIVEFGVENLKQSFFLKKHFGDIVEKYKAENKNLQELEKLVTEKFKSLVDHIARYYDLLNIDMSATSKEPLPVPKTLQEFNLFYKIGHPQKPFYNRGFSQDVQSVTDIHLAVVNSVIHSSMCCGKDKKSWAYQLYKIYPQYSETLLTNAMEKVHADKMVTVRKKPVTKKTILSSNCLPMSSSQYQLSNNYVYKFNTKWPYSMFKEVHDVLFKLSNWYCNDRVEDRTKDNFNGIELLVTGGLVGAIHDYVIREQIDFDIEIPDRVIMLDPRLKEQDDTYFRIAQRYQDVLADLGNLKFTQESSMETTSGVEKRLDTSCNVNKQLDENMCCEELNEINKRKRNDEEEVSELPDQKRKKLSEEIVEKKTLEKNEVISIEDKTLDEATEINDLKGNNEEKKESEEIALQKNTKHAFTRVNEILKHNPIEQRCLNSYCKIDDSDVRKQYTRIALLQMRQELNELTVADSHHAHEYFVVNMFKVFYSLYGSNDRSNQQNEIFKGLSMPLDFLPLTIKSINGVIAEINKFAVYPKDIVSYSDFTKNLHNYSLLDPIEKIYQFVRDKKEIGASIKELADEFENTLGENLHRIVSLLTENRLFLRSGVTIIRYIHHQYADAWLIRSYKIGRLEKESLAPVPADTVYITESKEILNKDNVNIIRKPDDNPSSSKMDCENVIEENERSEERDNENFDKDLSSHSDEECNSQVKRRMQRKRKLLPPKDISKVVKQLDLNTNQEVKVSVKPWIRVDGVVNRRVLDRMLGSILSYCLTHPGIALTKVQSRFSPPLQPCHTRELIEILVKLECLQRLILKKQRVTLFSKPSQIVPKIATNDWASEEDIFLEPASGAMLKFGLFLSTKMYSTEFIN